MPIRVIGRAAYLSVEGLGIEWRGIDHDASMFVKAIKGEPFIGYANVPDGESSERITSKDGAKAQRLLSRWAQGKLKAEFGTTPIALVPIPGSQTVDPQQNDFAARRMAE